MKQLTNNLLKINFKGIDLLNGVSKVEFAFSQEIGETPLKLAEYPGDSVVMLSNTSLGVIWTAAETKEFKADEYFYLDTRITPSDTAYQPETEIIKLKMNPTLFEGA